MTYMVRNPVSEHDKKMLQYFEQRCENTNSTICEAFKNHYCNKQFKFLKTNKDLVDHYDTLTNTKRSTKPATALE